MRRGMSLTLAAGILWANELYIRLEAGGGETEKYLLSLLIFKSNVGEPTCWQKKSSLESIRACVNYRSTSSTANKPLTDQWSYIDPSESMWCILIQHKLLRKLNFTGTDFYFGGSTAWWRIFFFYGFIRHNFKNFNDIFKTFYIFDFWKCWTVQPEGGELSERCYFHLWYDRATFFSPNKKNNTTATATKKAKTKNRLFSFLGSALTDWAL